MKIKLRTPLMKRFLLPCKSRSTPTNPRGGSALLITLLVVSLLMVLVLTFTVVVRMQLREVIQHQNRMQAQANARLGLNMALAKLQESAGPDTRVTAPYLDTSTNRPNVFHIAQALHSSPFHSQGGSLDLNDQYGQNAGYLISHDPDDSTFTPSSYWPYLGGESVRDGNVLLVGPGSTMSLEDAAESLVDTNNDGVPDGYVAAPLRDIENPDGNIQGRYAFHVRDNGLQAQVNLTDSFRIENEGRMDLPEQAITAQRVASEFLLPNFDPDSEPHQEFLDRVVMNSQLNLTPFVGEQGAKELFHDITLQSLGLPVNVKAGGFRRDLTAVIREAEDNGGEVPDGGTQWNKLTEFQAARMQLWRDQTQALSGESRPSGMPEHRWNALKALTLREDQNQPDTTVNNSRTRNSPETHPLLQEKIFPPMSDLWISVDPGGAGWKQLLTYATRFQRLDDGSGNLYSNLSAEATNELNPVVARIALNFYYTLDWPTIRLHLVPAFVLWNPYSEPLRTKADESWYFVWAWEPQHFRGWYFQMQFSHSQWDDGDPNWMNQWLPIPFQYSDNDAWFAFEFQNSTGGNSITLPPGEAVFFTMHQHESVPLDSDNKIPKQYRASLRQGLHELGGYSFYVEKDLEQWIKDEVQQGIDEGGWRRWSDFPIYDPDDPDTHPWQPFAANETGLSPSAGWTIENFAMHLHGRPGEDWSSMRNRGFYFVSEEGTPNWDNQMDGVNAHGTMNYLYQSVPGVFADAGLSDIDDEDGTNILPTFGMAPSSFDSSRPLDDTYPRWPGWGITWSLRMPNPVFGSVQTSEDGTDVNVMDANLSAPSRWLVDHNPTAPFHVGDPLAINKTSGTRGGSYRNPASYIGGFTMDPSHFDYTSMSHPDHPDNQNIGYSDDLALAGGKPRLVLYEIPRGIEDEDDEVRGSEEIASIANFMHARPHSLGHAWAYNVSSPNKLMQPRHFASGTSQGGPSYPGTDSLPNAPTYAIGNSFARTLIPREKATHAYFPGPNAQTNLRESIPYSENRNPVHSIGDMRHDGAYYYPAYDLSWIYNEVLWDDFILTPYANRRYLWENDEPERDFDESASKLLISGAFNINSTSVSAWAALLSSMLDVELDTRDNSSEARPNEERIPLTRFLEPLSAALSPDANQDFEHTSAYAGYRRLTQTEVVDLAEQIVEQVKARGPFLSISEFVNRMLIAAEDDSEGLGLAGALQTAINDAGLNDAMGTPSEDVWQSPSDFDGTWSGTDSGDAFHGMFLENGEGPRTAGSPGYLLQSDVLSRIGSVLQARSDTFTIRAYGSFGSDNSPLAQTWMEATVQRVPEFVDDENEPEALPDELTPLNRIFGRKFRIISFRLLSSEDI